MEEGATFIPDYSKYTLSELEDIYSRMQRDKFLERVTAIEVEINNKKIGLNKSPTLENLEIAGYSYEYAGFWKRTLAYIIDLLIVLSFFPISNYLLILSFNSRTILPTLFFSLLITAIMNYYIVIKFGGTPGHLIIKLRTINVNGKYLNFNRALLRNLTYMPSSIFSLLQLNNAINSVPSSVHYNSFMAIFLTISQNGGVYALLVSLSNYIAFFDIGTILFNKKKRAIHDFIAGSYVVTQESIREIEKLKSNLNCAK